MVKTELIKKTRIQVILTILILLLIRVGTNIPVPFINREMIHELFGADQFSLVNVFSGGALEKMSLFALGVSPYITAQIILQLLSVPFKRLTEIQREEKDKYEKILFIANIVLSLCIATSTTIYFYRSNFLSKRNIGFAAIIILILTAGSAALVLLGKLIDKKGIGNGISLILAAGIIATLPSDFVAAVRNLSAGKNIQRIVLIIAAVIAVALALIAFAIFLNESKRKIPVTYSGRVIGNRVRTSQDTYIPLSINPAGVVPVIFTSQIFAVILMFFHGGWTKFFSQSEWFRPESIKYSIGFILYAILTVGFAYFYTSITFDPYKTSSDLKKNGGMIPGIRPGKPTAEYLQKILKPIIFKGALGLLAIQAIPMLISGIFGINVSFGGTSILIIVGVVLETYNRMKAKKANTAYRSFLG